MSSNEQSERDVLDAGDITVAREEVSMCSNPEDCHLHTRRSENLEPRQYFIRQI
jgi:hypothetical protein